MGVKMYFSDYFSVSESELNAYGALNISLINDMPMFVDPFLIYESDDPKIRPLHDSIIDYIVYLRDYANNSKSKKINEAKIKSLFYFKEVKQNWLGFSKEGNGGSGLGKDFANKFIAALVGKLSNFGKPSTSKSAHLEKFTLIDDGVGRDKISDFTVNLIKKYLLEYTQKFARDHIESSLCREFIVRKVEFDYENDRWISGRFYLPCYDNDFVILTPKEILTKEETWINRNDMIDKSIDIAINTSNAQLRAEFSEMLFNEVLKRKQVSRPSLKDISLSLIEEHPEILDEYIALKEEAGQDARSLNDQEVQEIEKTYIELVRKFSEKLLETDFYGVPSLKKKVGSPTFEAAMERIKYLKTVIEHNDGYRIFFDGDMKRAREDDIQIMFRLTWLGTPFDVNREVNNGRGPADYSISHGRDDKTIVEFKLGSSTLASIKKNILNQVDIYKKAGDAKHGIVVILCFAQSEIDNIQKMVKSIENQLSNNVIIIDATPNKKSASKANDVKPAEETFSSKDGNQDEGSQDIQKQSGADSQT